MADLTGITIESRNIFQIRMIPKRAFHPPGDIHSVTYGVVMKTSRKYSSIDIKKL